MLRKLLTVIALLGLTNLAIAQSQSGTLKGTITEHGTGEVVPLANVILEQNGAVVGGAVADFDGKYTIKPIDPGRYTVQVSFIGFATKEIQDVLVSPNKITFINAKLKLESEVLGTIEVVEYVVPLIDPDKTGQTRTREEITALPTRSVASVAAQTAGVYQEDEGSAINVRGSRSDATFYYIDGVKVRASSRIPQASIEQMTVITGGLPASYGDAMGGVISITTRGPSNEFFGGIELVSSSLLDPYGYNLVGFNLSGPLLKDDNGQSKLGFFLAGEVESVKDNDPSSIDLYKINDTKLKYLQENPLIFSLQNGIVQAQRASEYITMDDLEVIDAKQEAERLNIAVQGKIDFKPTKNTNFTIGGNYTKVDRSDYIFTYSLFNPENNPQVIDNSWRVYGRFQQSFGNPEGEQSASTMKNAFFTLQADYSKDLSTTQDEDHKDNLFNYGYIGEFTAERDTILSNPWNFDETVDFYMIDDNGDSLFVTGEAVGHIDEEGNFVYDFSQSANPISNYYFKAGDINPYATNYTEQYYDYLGESAVITDLNEIRSIGALVNGDRSDYVYSTFYNTGRAYNGYSKSEESQLRFTGSASTDINDHAIQFGFEYEQRDDRYYGVSPTALWSLAELRVNNYINQFQGAYELLGYDDASQTTLLGLNHSFNFDQMSDFATNFRDVNGIAQDQIVDIHSYTPEDLDISMFSADQIMNYATWYGFDYTGARIEGVQPGMAEFLESDGDEHYKREVGAFQPIYVSGYIQDKFAFEDLIFNIGVRVDRYDANQEVLLDKYSLYQVITVGEDDIYDHPSNIGDDYVIYVDDNANHSTVTGYRNGDNWYDANGLPITDPEILNVSGKVMPMLLNPGAINDEVDALNKGLTADAFTDYTPQVTFMPRISFNFPISDEAMFYAHYDVLAQRPSGNRMDPIDYLQLAQLSGTYLSNSDLKPQRTTDYEIGFKQTLSSSSAMQISAFYKEMRDMMTYTKVGFAFPKEYNTYGNIDFGTVKGLSVGYEMRRTKNISLNANYTMQFADGSGSSSTSGAGIVNSGQPNLRTTMPLDYDQRHNLTTSIDFRYGSGKNYNGPLFKGHQILSNMGVNIVATAGSGTPYSRQENATREGFFGINQRSNLSGSINGSRLPWRYRLDMRVNKSFDLKWGDEENQKSASVNVYLQVQNLLNAANILTVYQYTGNPDDDGFMSTPEGEATIAASVNPQSLMDLYAIKLNNPDNYTRPRTVRLGLTLDF